VVDVALGRIVVPADAALRSSGGSRVDERRRRVAGAGSMTTEVLARKVLLNEYADAVRVACRQPMRVDPLG